MSLNNEIYVIRSAASPIREPGAAGEEMRSIDHEGEKEIQQLGIGLVQLVTEPIREVRFAPANRTRRTALGAIGLTCTSIHIQRDEQLTNTDPKHLRQYLDDISDEQGPVVLFTHLDVIQSMVEALNGRRPDDEAIPTATLTRIDRTPDGPKVIYVGRTIDEATKSAAV